MAPPLGAQSCQSLDSLLLRRSDVAERGTEGGVEVDLRPLAEDFDAGWAFFTTFAAANGSEQTLAALLVAVDVFPATLLAAILATLLIALLAVLFTTLWAEGDDFDASFADLRLAWCSAAIFTGPKVNL